MEEDIKVLEELCFNFKYQQSKLDELERDDYTEFIQDIEIIAIENLIARYKELEEENEKLKLLMRNPCDIPKKIIVEKMNADIKTNEHTILGGRRNGKTLEYGIRLGRIQMCEELLQEGDK